ncbi:MAG: GDSL-type esterase/lipase family protein [Faecalibacterium sp.]
MADYQEYRRRVLHKRWRRIFITASLLVTLVLLITVSALWKSLHRVTGQTGPQVSTVLQKEQQGTDWNTLNYVPAQRLKVQTMEDGSTAADFRMVSVPASAAVDRSYFSQASFLGDSLTQGMQLYDTGLPNAHFCAYKGVGPNAVVNGTLCKRADGVQEVPMEALHTQQPRLIYVLLGTNVLGRDSDYSSFLTYYRLMLDMLTQEFPNADIYVQSITPVRPEVSKEENHAGLNRDRLCRINNELAAVALEKNCYFLNLWEALADENGDLKQEYAQPDGYHLRPEGYTAWVEYLRTHVAS